MVLSLSQVVKIFFAMAVFLFPFEQALLFFFGFDNILKPYRAALVLAILFLPFSRFRLAPRAFWLLAAFAGLYTLGFALALFWSISSPVSLGTTVHQLILVAFATSYLVLAAYCIETPEQLDRLIMLVLAAVIISTGIWYIDNFTASFYRATGFFRNPNHFAYMLALSILFSIYAITRSSGKRMLQLVLALYIPFAIFMLILSGSRSVLATITPSLLFFVFCFITMPGRGASRRMITGLIGLMVLIISALIIVNSNLLSARLLERFSAEHLATGSGRWDLWRAGLLAAEDYLFTGLGIGQYLHQHSYYIRQVSGSVYDTVFEFDLGLHSEFVNMLVEFGVLGLLLYSACLVALWITLRRFYKDFPEWRHLANVLQAAFLFDLLFSASQDMYTFAGHWIILAFCASLLKLRHVAARQTQDDNRMAGEKFIHRGASRTT